MKEGAAEHSIREGDLLLPKETARRGEWWLVIEILDDDNVRYLWQDGTETTESARGFIAQFWELVR